MRVLMTLSSNAIYHGLTQAQTHVTKQPKFQRLWHMFAVGMKSGEFALSSGNVKGLRSKLHFHNCTNATWHMVKHKTNNSVSLPNMFSLPPYCKWRIEMRLYVRPINRWLSLCPIPTCPIPRYQTTASTMCVDERMACVCVSSREWSRRKEPFSSAEGGGVAETGLFQSLNRTQQISWADVFYFPSSAWLPLCIKIITGRVFLTLTSPLDTHSHLKWTSQNKNVKE